MPQAITLSSVAAIVAVIIALLLTVFIITIWPTKTNSNIRYPRNQLNGRISDGLSVRILSLATGRYLRRRKEVPDACVSDAKNSPNVDLVTADAKRVEATVWKMKLCTNCPPAGIYANYSNTLLRRIDVSGRWVIYDGVQDNDIRVLTFINPRQTTPYPDGYPIPYFDLRTVKYTDDQFYSAGVVDEDGNTIQQPFNNLYSPFWMELTPINPELEYRGPNGAYYINTVLDSFTNSGTNRKNFLTVNNSTFGVSPGPNPCYALSASTVGDPIRSGFFFEVI